MRILVGEARAGMPAYPSMIAWEAGYNVAASLVRWVVLRAAWVAVLRGTKPRGAFMRHRAQRRRRKVAAMQLKGSWTLTQCRRWSSKAGRVCCPAPLRRYSGCFLA